MRVILETEKLEAISHRVNNLQEGEIVQWKKRAREIEKLRGQVPRYRSPFPDLSVEQKTASCGCGFAKVSGKRFLPADAKQFSIGQSHKQGPQLITEGMIRNGELQFLGGRKT